jgi:nucleoside-diphosphate-sugar epimerase
VSLKRTCIYRKVLRCRIAHDEPDVVVRDPLNATQCWGRGVSEAVLITGATGTVGAEVCEQMRALAGYDVVRVARSAADGRAEVAWTMGAESPPQSLRGHWNYVIHCAADTRWTMDDQEALQANLASTVALRALIDRDTQLIHVSTAYSDGLRGAGTSRQRGDYRNAYEYSKALAEQWVAENVPTAVIVRPPMIIGRSSDGDIARPTGVYTLFQGLTSGMLAAVVGSPQARIELAPVDAVAHVIVSAVRAQSAVHCRRITVSGGSDALTLSELIARACARINDARQQHGIADIEVPPVIEREKWDRFFLPFARDYLTKRQLAVIELLSAFNVYTSSDRGFEPDWPVREIGNAFDTCVAWWCQRFHRTAMRVPIPWRLKVS